MMIRPAELASIKRGEIDLAFRRWDRPRVRVGTRLRTAVGLLEVTSVEQVAVSSLRAEDARRAGSASLAALTQALEARAERPLFRVGLRYAGADPREELRERVPTAEEIDGIHAWMERLDRASTVGPWTRATLQIIDRSPGVRAPELAAELGRETLEWKRDVRKLKEKGLTESLAIGYRLSPRGEAVLDHGGPARDRVAARGGHSPAAQHRRARHPGAARPGRDHRRAGGDLDTLRPRGPARCRAGGGGALGRGARRPGADLPRGAVGVTA